MARVSLARRHPNLPESGESTNPVIQQPVGQVIAIEFDGSLKGQRVLRRGAMKRQSILGCILVLCLALGFGTSTSLGQAVYGSIIGTVTDPQGNAVAGAKVTVTSVTKNTSEETTTNDSGNFSVIHLIPDTYRVKVEGSGFKAYDVASVLVQVDTTVRVDAQLQVGAITQTVEVTSEVPQLKTDRADVALDFSSDYVEKLPLVNRNFQSLLLSAPGTQQIGWSHAATENPQGSQQTFVQGQHFSGTGYELDGTDNQDPILGIIIINPNLDSVEEAKITLMNYDAEFGKAIAGLMVASTKSGTRSFHRRSGISLVVRSAGRLSRINYSTLAITRGLVRPTGSAKK